MQQSRCLVAFVAVQFDVRFKVRLFFQLWELLSVRIYGRKFDEVRRNQDFPYFPILLFRTKMCCLAHSVRFHNTLFHNHLRSIVLSEVSYNPYNGCIRIVPYISYDRQSLPVTIGFLDSEPSRLSSRCVLRVKSDREFKNNLGSQAARTGKFCLSAQSQST